MKKNKIIGLILVVIVLSSTYLIYNNSIRRGPINLEKVVSSRLHEILGYEISIGSLSVDEQSRKLSINDLGLSLSKESEIFLRVGKLEGVLPKDYKSLDEIVISNLSASNISLPIIDNKSVKGDVDLRFSQAYKDFYDVNAVVEITKKNSSKILQERFSDLKNLLSRYKLTKSEAKSCSNKRTQKKCKRISLKKLKIQKEILSLVEDKSFYNLKQIVKENGDAIQTSEFNEENILKFLLKNKQSEIVDSMIGFMKSLYDAQFVNLKSEEDIPHLRIKEITIREKISKIATKELVGSIKDLSSIRSKMKDKTVFRIQGDFDKYNMKGISFRMVLHRGKNNAVSINSHLLDMKLSDYYLFNGSEESLQIEEASGSVRVKSFIFGGVPKGSITTDLKGISFYKKGYGKQFSKLDNLNIVTNYERKEEGSYTDTLIKYPNKFKLSEVEAFEKDASNAFEKVLNSNEEMLSTYNVFLKNYAVNFNLVNEELIKLWPKYKATNIRLDNQQ